MQTSRVKTFRLTKGSSLVSTYEMLCTKSLILIFAVISPHLSFQTSNGTCVTQQICHAGASPEDFRQLMQVVKEMQKKLLSMESKLDSIGDCCLNISEKRGT